ncbi:MAG: bifunctional 4-hydroxy-2-oxoglutarate aldolase/2-dehydro-3-deoxy-phosphogluconate aldolase [Acidobacteriota bacterium]|nr:bifunctional 4-hydroxy-2-oxoglutarate aldolase/2-dehydro-3-deoxy-phosphogluconate aldolase [Acidobacteriota bacterium]
MNRQTVLDILLETKIVAVVRMKERRKLESAVRALRAGGIKAVEITLTTPGALEAVASLIEERKAAEFTVGAGTVLDAASAEEAVRAGAEFLVSPITDTGMIEVGRRAECLVAPGAFTPTEIVQALRAGADIVKIFPATSLGPQFFKDIRGPLPGARLMPTGGVTPENAPDFIRAGACCVGIGTALLDAATLTAEDWDGLTRKTRALVESLRKT